MTTKKNLLFLATTILICMLPNILLIFVGEDSVTGTFTKKIVYLILGLAIVIAPLTFLKPKWYAMLVFFLSPYLLFELYNVSMFKAPSTEEAVASIFLTNYGEARELLGGNILSLVFSIILILFSLWIAISIQRKYSLSKKVRVRIFFFVVFVFFALYGRNLLAASKLNDNFSETIGLANYSLRIQMSKVYPTDVIIKTQGALTGIKQRKNYTERVKNVVFNARKADTLDSGEVYVLVIGETARKHNFGIYGYNRNTTPNLDTIKGLNYFTDVYSAANLTSLSLPFILTRATPEKVNLKFEEPAILNLYKEAGFKTYWISNVPSGIGSVFGFYSSLADYYKNTAVSLDAINYDEKLIPELEKVLEDSTSQKKFIVIHTLGSHFRYNYRYPTSFEKFTPNLVRGISIENSTSIDHKNEIINSYDNSILYTDYVLSQLIFSLQKQKKVSFLYYISDHGENLYDDDQNKLLHAYINPTKYEIEIPLVIWTSHKYKQIYFNKYHNLVKHTSEKISSLNTFHTLLDMSNIIYDEQDLAKSFSSSVFSTEIQRLFYKTDKTILQLDQ